jgi:hypothetical protein
VRRLSIRPNGWSVSAAVRNNTRTSFLIERPHHPGQTEFGLLVLDSGDVEAVERAGPGVFATRFEPPLPRVLRARGEWSGTFSGQGRAFRRALRSRRARALHELRHTAARRSASVPVHHGPRAAAPLDNKRE